MDVKKKEQNISDLVQFQLASAAGREIGHVVNLSLREAHSLACSIILELVDRPFDEVTGLVTVDPSGREVVTRFSELAAPAGGCCGKKRKQRKVTKNSKVTKSSPCAQIPLPDVSISTSSVENLNYCPRCGKILWPYWLHCPHCGSSLP
jgi:hypothetical protein